VEATKFTEVGYVGRDVESMIRDLVGTSIRLVKQREIDKVAQKTEAIVNDRLLDAIVPVKRKENAGKSPYDMIFGGQARPAQQQTEPQLAGPTEDEIKSRRELCRQELLEGKLEDLTIDIMVDDNDSVPIGVMGSGGGEEITMNMSNMLGSIFPKKKKKRRTTVAAARKIFTAEESQRLIDMDAIVEEGLRLAEQDGIIFLDEIDKIAGNGYKGSGPDISREGVQRDILPIVEGCTVTTKYGPSKQIISCSSARALFHMSKVSDLIPDCRVVSPSR
jgi:ATP-dependent HslUV protease ATP-binding subunit HslU